MVNILVVDDDEGILEALQLMLDYAGYNTYTTDQAHKTFDIVKEYKPCLILLDVLMSGIDGREIASNLKQNKSTKNIPIIMISAHPSASKSVASTGADDFVSKPFDMDKLLMTIAKHLQETAN